MGQLEPASGEKMNRRRRTFTVIASTLAILGISCVCVWQYCNRADANRLQADKASFEAQIAQSLPLGSEKARVKGFLDSRHMAYVETEPIPSNSAAENNVTSVIEAVSRDRVKLLLGSCSLSAKFNFDSHGALLGHTGWHSCKSVW
jgi:hypothetical protein